MLDLKDLPTTIATMKSLVNYKFNPFSSNAKKKKGSDGKKVKLGKDSKIDKTYKKDGGTSK